MIHPLAHEYKDRPADLSDRQLIVSRRYWPAALPIVLLFAVMNVLWIADLRTSYPAVHLNILLNIIFIALNSLFIAYLAARSFITRGEPSLLLLGCGVLVWSASGIIAVALGRGDPNLIVTIHNLCAGLSAACHLGSALLSMQGGFRLTARDVWLGVAYVMALGVVALIALAANAGWTPTFFIQGQGGTPLRQTVLGATILMFIASALILGISRRGSISAFACWYALGLLLIATGIFGVMIQTAYGSLLGWIGRLSQYLGGIYMLVAAVAAVRESGAWEVALESQLNEARQDYTNLLDLAADGIAVYEPPGTNHEGRFLSVNPALCRLLGYTADELMGMPPGSLLAVEKGAAVSSGSGAPGEPPSERYETRLTARDGSVIAVEINTRFFEQHRRPRVMSIVRDITERKQMEAAVQESVERYQLVIEGASAAIWDWDVKNRKVFFSPQWKALRGLEESEVGDSEAEWSSRIHPDDAPRVSAAVQAHFEGRTPIFAQEYRIKCKDGSWKWVSDRGLARRDAAGRIVRMAGSEMDITERKRAHEELETKVRERTAELTRTLEQIRSVNATLDHQAQQLRALTGELTMTEQRERKRFSTLLHDGLQQYLAAAKMQVGAIRGQTTDASVRETADAIEAILGEALKISRSLTLELSPPILHDGGLAAGLHWLQRWMREKHGFEVGLVLEAITEPVEDIRILLFEAVRELLFNAAKHSRVNRANVRLAQTDARLQIVIRDEGAGFDPEALKPSGGDAGGFGLFTIFERLKLVGGALEIDSAPGKGSTFRLHVPVNLKTPAVMNAERLGPPDDASQASAVTHSIRILLADDHALFRDGLARLLSREPDIRVVGQAASGREAIALAKSVSPDVILMDISMPDVNGIEAAGIITRRHPHIRVIGLSMHDDRARELMLGAGAVDFRTKSCPPAELIQAVRSCLEENPSKNERNCPVPAEGAPAEAGG